MLRAWALTTTLSVFESVQAKSVKIKKSSEALGWSKKLFVRRFENDTFESVFFKSVEIESVVVSAHTLWSAHIIIIYYLWIFPPILVVVTWKQKLLS